MNECGIDVAQCVKRNRNRLNEQRTSARHGHSGRKSTCTSSGRFPSTTQGVMSEVGRGGNRKTKNARAKNNRERSCHKRGRAVAFLHFGLLFIVFESGDHNRLYVCTGEKRSIYFSRQSLRNQGLDDVPRPRVRRSLSRQDWRHSAGTQAANRCRVLERAR